MKMGKNNKHNIMNQLPLWDMVTILFSNVIFGGWMLCKMLAKWIWDPKTFIVVQQRDSPPPCLVDSSLGHHKYVKLKGVKLHYVESGDRNLPLLLLLHGFPDCWLSWRHQIPILMQYFHVVALDLKGFGDSDKPSRRALYRTDIIMEELQQFIITVGHEGNCTIIGHDIGGLIGWCLAHRYPEIVNKLIVVAAPHPNVYKDTIQQLPNYHWLNFVQLPYFPEIDALKDDVKLISDCHRHLKSNDIYLEAYKYTFSRKEDWTGALNYYRNLLHVEIAADSPLVQVPVVLIIGDNDDLVKLKSIVKSTDFCCDNNKCLVKIVDGAGHFPHQETPERFNEILLKCLVVKKKKSVDGEEKLDMQLLSSKGIMNRVFGAVSTTVKIGNSMLDSVHKRTNGVVGNIPTMNLLSYGNIHDKT